MKTRTHTFLILFLALSFLTGCGLMPKNVEYFQDRVEAVPQLGHKANETLKQSAELASRRAKATEIAAIETGADDSVRIPARDASVLTEAVSDRVGEPLHPARADEVDKLVARLNAQEARHDREIEEYKAEIADLVGKKIEGSGAIQLGYFTNLLFAGVAIFLGLIVIKVLAMLNPAASVLVNGVQATGTVAARGFSEVLNAGEAFKDRLIQKVPGYAEDIKEIFASTHKEYQSADTQQLVRQATNRK